MKKYDLIIVTSEPFPIGQAASNRILCYASKMAETKKIAIYTWAAPYGCDYPLVGTCLGVDYYHMQKITDFLKRARNRSVRAPCLS